MKRFGLAALLVFDLILFAPLLVTRGVFSSHDFVRAHHPWRMTEQGVITAENRLLSDPAASGQTTLVRFRDFPSGLFWNPWVSSGSIGPFHLAQGYLSPFVALPALLLPEAAIETGILFLKLNFAFLAAYAFLRSRKFSDLSAAAGACAWAFATGQTVWGLWMQSSVSVTYPLLLMAVDRAFEEERFSRAVRFAALSILLCLSGGFPHWILYGVFAASLYGLLRAVEHRGRGALRALGRLGAAAAIAAAILLPSILGTARFLRESGYGQLRQGLGGAYALPLRHLRLYFLPDYQGSPRRDDYRGIGWIPGDNFIETAAGVGVAAGGLAFLGLTALGRRREALYAAILGCAIAIPLYAGGKILAAVGSLPLVSIGLFARSKILILLAAAILVACGIEALERREGPSLARRLALQTAPFLIAVPLAFFALDFYPVCRPEEAVFRETAGTRRLREALSGGERFAAAGWTLLPNVGEALRLPDARGHFLSDAGYRRLVSAADPNAFGTYGTYLALDPLSVDPSSPVLDLLSVRYLAAPPGAPGPAGPEVEALDAASFHPPGAPVRPSAQMGRAAFPRVYDGPDLTLFERPSAFPRFRLVAGTLPGGVEQVRSADRRTLERSVYVSPAEHQRLSSGQERRTARGTVAPLESAPERFVVETDTSEPALLVTTQKRFPPYWRAYVDERQVESFAANGLFLGIEVPAGRHLVEGRFVIPRAELAVAACGALALLAVMIAARSR